MSQQFNDPAINQFKIIPDKNLHTLTLDNGKEFSDFKEVEKDTGLLVCFAGTYASWQRGTNEHTNGLIRRYFPKGTNFSTITKDEFEAVVNKINNRPRKSLNYMAQQKFSWPSKWCT